MYEDPAQPAPRTTLDATAPRTALDGTAAPGTTLDGAPRTSLDATTAPPRTTLDGAPGTLDRAPGTLDGARGTTLDGTPGTTLDGAPGTTLDTPTARPAQHRVNLPAALLGEYRLERVLGSGGEADLLLAVRLDTGAQVVVRRYRENRAQLDQGLLDRLATADRGHLIGVLDWGQDADAVWEILEYAPYGSLAELMQERRPPWPADEVSRLLGELGAAIEYAHSLQIVHRDIKPQNVLIRSRQPLDLVLTDFGLTRVLTATEMMATTSRTSAYAAPEAAAGAVSRGLDWWALGMLVVELLTGRHPFQRPDGGWLNDMQILKQLTTREIPLDGIADERWRSLCAGLLTRDPRLRWGHEQVRRWWRGENPEVAPRGQGAQRAERPLNFRNTALYTAGEAAAAFRANWADASRLVRGRQMRSPGYLALSDWVADLGIDRARAVLDRDGPPDRVLTQLILAMDPTAQPVYRGRALSTAGLTALIRAAPGDRAAADVLDGVYAEGILDAVDGAPGCPDFGRVAERWRRLVEIVEQLAPPAAPLRPDQLRAARVRMLVAAMTGQNPAAGDAAAARADSMSMNQGWFRVLAGIVGGTDQPAYDELVAQLRDVAADRTAQDQAQARAQEQWAQQQQRAASRARVDRMSAGLAFGLGLASLLIPYLGLLVAPAAVYFGIRARRTPAAGCLSSVGLVLGLLVTIGYTVGLIVYFSTR